MAPQKRPRWETSSARRARQSRARSAHRQAGLWRNDAADAMGDDRRRAARGDLRARSPQLAAASQKARCRHARAGRDAHAARRARLRTGRAAHERLVDRPNQRASRLALHRARGHPAGAAAPRRAKAPSRAAPPQPRAKSPRRSCNRRNCRRSAAPRFGDARRARFRTIARGLKAAHAGLRASGSFPG